MCVCVCVRERERERERRPLVTLISGQTLTRVGVFDQWSCKYDTASVRLKPNVLNTAHLKRLNLCLILAFLCASRASRCLITSDGSMMLKAKRKSQNWKVNTAVLHGFKYDPERQTLLSCVMFRLIQTDKHCGLCTMTLGMTQRCNDCFCRSYASWRVSLDGARVSGLRCRVCLHCLGGSMSGLLSLRSHTIWITQKLHVLK